MPDMVRALPDAIASATRAIVRAEDVMASNAAKVAQSGAQLSQQAVQKSDRVSVSPEARSLLEDEAAESGADGSAENVDLTELLIEQRLAKHYLAANVKVLRTADEMNQVLIDAAE